MQIFEYDYETGKRGKKLGDKYFSGTGIGLGISNNMIVHEYILGEVNTNKKENQVEHIHADDFGVTAIMCCTGKEDDIWDWIVVCNKSDAEKAKNRNMRKFGHKHARFTNMHKLNLV